MKVTAAVVRAAGQPFEIADVELDAPRPNEILVKLVATGLCHTDIVVRDAGLPIPGVLGHKGGNRGSCG